MTCIRHIPSSLSLMADGMSPRIWAGLRKLPVVEVGDAGRS